MKAWPLTLVLLAATGLLLLAPQLEARLAPATTLGDTGVEHSWTITKGPDWQSDGPWVGGGPGYKLQGRITPPFPPNVTAKITSVVCVGGGTTPPVNKVAGSATGASFTLYIKEDAWTDCDPIEVCYTSNATDEGGNPTNAKYCVEVADPGSPTSAGLDPTVSGVPRDFETIVPVYVTGRNQQIKTSFTGSITVIAGSIQGSGVLVNGSSGMIRIRIVEGVGSMSVRTVNGIEGDTLTFDMLGDGRIAIRRSSLAIW